jgi:hypothetical protein
MSQTYDRSMIDLNKQYDILLCIIGVWETTGHLQDIKIMLKRMLTNVGSNKWTIKVVRMKPSTKVFQNISLSNPDKNA